jgi:TrmH family RNA methyltransferase
MIESKNNEKVKYYAKLNDKKYRKSEKLFIASGEHLVSEALKKNIVKEILLLEGEENIYGNATYVSKEVLKKISNLDTNPKVLAVCHIRENHEIKGNVIILDDIKDPGNLGTIIRSAVAFNYETIILSNSSVDIYNSKVVRSAEGMLFNVNIIIDDLAKIINDLKDKNYKIYGTDVKGGTFPSLEENKHALIIGSEARGMSEDLKELCDKCLYIKMNSKCESLNAGVSASILMYELNGRDAL